MYPNRSYLVCATPRSGSTLLCEALINTRIAGYPREYFEALQATGLPRQPREYFTTLQDTEIADLLGNTSRLDHMPINVALHHASSYAEYLHHVLQEGTTPNGVFGAKIMWGYFDDFISRLREQANVRNMSIPDILSTVFPHLQYIWVTRRDKVRQAVSLWKAIQTWTWHEIEVQSSHDTFASNLRSHAQKERDEASAEDNHHLSQKQLHFHFGAIDHLVQQIREQDQMWQHYFQEAATEPYQVMYEDLSLNYEATARDILTYLHIPVTEHLIFAERKMKQQADELSEEWVQHYLSLKHKQEMGEVSLL